MSNEINPMAFFQEPSVADLRLLACPGAEELTALFGFNIPQRWSIAHLYQAMLNGEPHVKEISFLTTLAGFLHWKLTGEKRMGVGEASGMFPIGRGQRELIIGDRQTRWRRKWAIPGHWSKFFPNRFLREPQREF